MYITIVNRTVLMSFFLGIVCAAIVVGVAESGDKESDQAEPVVENDAHPNWPPAIVQPFDWSVLQVPQSKRKLRRIELCIYRQDPAPLESVEPRREQIDCATEDARVLKLFSDVLSKPVLRMNDPADTIQESHAFSGELGHLRVVGEKDEFVIGITEHGFVLHSTRQNWHRVFFIAGLAMFLDEMLLKQEDERPFWPFGALSGGLKGNFISRCWIREVLHSDRGQESGNPPAQQITPPNKQQAIATTSPPDWSRLQFDPWGDCKFRRVELTMTKISDRDDLKQPAFHWATQDPKILKLFRSAISRNVLRLSSAPAAEYVKSMRPYIRSLGRLSIDTGDDPLVIGITTEGFMFQSATYDPDRIFFSHYLAILLDEVLSWQQMPGLPEPVVDGLSFSAVDASESHYLRCRRLIYQGPVPERKPGK